MAQYFGCVVNCFQSKRNREYSLHKTISLLIVNDAVTPLMQSITVGDSFLVLRHKKSVSVQKYPHYTACPTNILKSSLTL